MNAVAPGIGTRSKPSAVGEPGLGRAHRAATADVVVVGGGIIGLATAYYCARLGLRPLVIERDRIGAHASRAAAGMLAAQAEPEEAGPLLELGLAGREEYRRLAAELAAQGMGDVGWRPEGILRVACSPHEAQELENNYRWQQREGLAAHWLTPDEVAEEEPLLDKSAIVAGVLLPEEGQVEPEKLIKALAAAAQRLGATLWQQTPVTSWIYERPGHIRVSTPRGPVDTPALVLAAGPWTPSLLAHLDLAAPVAPVKGQTLRLAASPSLRRSVFGFGYYLVPKEGGRLVVGATMEDAGFDTSPTLEAALSLGGTAARLCPALKKAHPMEIRVGLRPATPDKLPLMGELPGCPGVYVAAGHGRNGILLGPLSGRYMASLCANSEPPDLRELWPKGFRGGTFQWNRLAVDRFTRP